MPTPSTACLSPEERLALIGRLWDSLDDGDLALTSAQRDELDRRLADLEGDRAERTAWPDLRDELRQRLR